jgi:hypothetical protein
MICLYQILKTYIFDRIRIKTEKGRCRRGQVIRPVVFHVAFPLHLFREDLSICKMPIPEKERKVPKIPVNPVKN